MKSTQELVDTIARAIDEGRYPVGSLLPSEAQLQEEYEVTRYRMREAMASLRKLGVIDSRAGVGTQVLARNPAPFFVHSQQTLETIVEAARTTQLRLQRSGLVKTDDVDVARHVDLGIGVVPIVNLEWIQKIHRDGAERGYSADVIVDTILRRMPDYVNYITPQFSRTDINFQRVSTVDTSNPFITRDIPTPDESFIVIRFREPKGVDFPYLLNMIPNSFMSRRNTIVVPGAKMGFAMELILAPLIQDMIANKNK